MVGVPVLGRPQNAQPISESIHASVHAAEVLFLCSLSDRAQIDAAYTWGDAIDVMPFAAGPGDFARKHNAGYRYAVDLNFDWYFVGADDLTFHPGWFEACMREHEHTGACVIGTNDLHNKNVQKGLYATHFLVHRDYLECGTIDEDGKILHEGYDHQSVDIEFCQTANYRGTYAHAFDAIVEHRHPHWGLAEMDATYEKALRRTHEDIALFNARRHMWSRSPRVVRR